MLVSKIDDVSDSFSDSNNDCSFHFLCSGIRISWEQKPPQSVSLNEMFNVSYRLEVDDQFYTSMFAFDFSEYRAANIRSQNQTCVVCSSNRTSIRASELFYTIIIDYYNN